MKRLVLASALVSILLINGTVFAQGQFHRGTIVAYHLNPDVPARGPCVQTEPEAPTTWICLYRTGTLYEETRELLRDANQLGRECTFEWTSTDADGWAVLRLLECF
jgi:hypothetical protein